MRRKGRRTQSPMVSFWRKEADQPWNQKGLEYEVLAVCDGVVVKCTRNGQLGARRPRLLKVSFGSQPGQATASLEMAVAVAMWLVPGHGADGMTKRAQAA